MSDKTKSEHLAAETYQAGFSSDGLHVYTHILCGQGKCNIHKTTRKSCYENDAFEVKDKNGRYINQNSAEKGLAYYDATMPNIRSTLTDSYNQYLQGKSFVVPDETIIQLKEFITQQIFRQPTNLKSARKEFVETLSCFGNNFDSLEAEGIMQKLLLPQADDRGQLIQGVQQTFAENMIYKNLQELSVHIEVTNRDTIISSDSPIVAFTDNTSYFKIQIDKIIFPITSKIVVVLSKDVLDVVPLSDDDVTTINNAIAERALTQIISYSPISEDDFNKYLKLNRNYKQIKKQQKDDEQDNNRPILASLQQLSDIGYLEIISNPTNQIRPEIVILQKDRLLKKFVEYYIDMAIMMQPTISYHELITSPLINNDTINKQQEFINKVNEYGWNKSLSGMVRALTKT